MIEVHGAPFDERHGIPNGAVPGHDDHEDVGIAIERRFEHARAANARQPQIGEHHVEGELTECRDGFFAGVGLHDVEARVGQLVGDGGAEGGLVFDEEEMRFTVSHLPGVTRFWRSGGPGVNAIAEDDRCR